MALLKPSPCPLCSSESLRLKADALYDMDTPDKDISQACGVTLAQLSYHYEKCASKIEERDSRMEAEAAAERERQAALAELQASVQYHPPAQCDGYSIMDGPNLVARLEGYLKQIESLIHTPDPNNPKAFRVSLAALDQARKIVETMSKLYLDVMKAQLDADVQNEFRRIVMEAINAADPATRQRIIAEIQSRSAIFGTLGGPGM